MDAFGLAQILWPYVLSYIAGHGGSILLDKIRSRIHIARNVVDVLDNALNDPNVTDAQFKALWDGSKQLFQK